MGWDCLDENLLAEFAEGLVSAEDAVKVEEHLDECPDCAAVTAQLARLLSVTGPTREVTPTCSTGRTDNARPWLTRGDVVGRYVVLEWLGSGGMGEVYAADDPELGRRVALKLVRAGADRRAA